MDQTLIEKLIELAPQLGLLLLFIAALGLLLREYGKLRSEMRQTVEDAVSARLGSILGNLQVETAKASALFKDIELTHAKVQSFTGAFESSLETRESQINETLVNLEEKLKLLRKSVPETGDLNYSAQDFTALASEATSQGEAFALLQKAREDPDATSRDLEHAGDVARKFRRYSMARQFYEKAVELDPENSSAELELLALLAETDSKRRKDHLGRLMQLAVRTRNPPVLVRVANALIELNKYDELEQLCRDVIANAEEPSSKVKAKAHRNLAVALRRKGQLLEAESNLEASMSIDPEDENLLKIYIAVLQETGKFSTALKVAKKLVTIDPTDWYYCVILARIYNDIKDYDRALIWYQRAEPAAQSPSDKYTVQKEMYKNKLLRDFSGEEASVAGEPLTSETRASPSF